MEIQLPKYYYILTRNSPRSRCIWRGYRQLVADGRPSPHGVLWCSARRPPGWAWPTARGPLIPNVLGLFRLLQLRRELRGLLQAHVVGQLHQELETLDVLGELAVDGLVRLEGAVVVARPPVAAGNHELPFDLIRLHEAGALKVRDGFLAYLRRFKKITLKQVY